jgi:hypothetical protein
MLSDFYIVGFLPLTIFLMLLIGWTTPFDIITDTFESKLSKMYYPELTLFSIVGASIICILGVILALIDLDILQNGNIQGYTVLSFGLMILSFCFLSLQGTHNNKFLTSILERIKLKINIYGHIEEKETIEKWLYFSRILLLIGVMIVIFGGIFIYVNNFKLTYLGLVGLGFSFMVFGGGLERFAFNKIYQAQILKKITL